MSTWISSAFIKLNYDRFNYSFELSLDAAESGGDEA